MFADIFRGFWPLQQGCSKRILKVVLALYRFTHSDTKIESLLGTFFQTELHH